MRTSPGIIAIFLACLILQACNGTTDPELPANFDRRLMDELSEKYVPFEPSIGAAVPVSSEPPLVAASLPYPPFNPHDLKTIGPDDTKNRERLLNAGIGGIKLNLIWSAWQPAPNLSLNAPNTFSYDGQVWMISASKEKLIRWYSSQGIKVTAVMFGTPEWARPVNTSRAKNVTLVDEKFIAPDNSEDFARFAGMLAKRFNGANGHGRIVNFVVQNEVNSLDWYNPGCGADGFPCVIEDRINHYADLYNRTYDRIVSEQPQARVMHSFDHHFGEAFFDHPRFSSGKRFIETLEPLVGDRQWRVSIHSYPPDLFNPAFGPYDYPKITFGNIGILVSYMRQRFPDKPHAWDIHLTENGINSGSPSNVNAMEQQLGVATRNVVGTPGIETFYYHRLADHPQEGAFTPGLFDRNGNPKLAWSRWSTNNITSSQPPRLGDGYEHLPYVRLERSAHPTIGHWASTRQPPAGYNREGHFWLLREPIENTRLLYECHDDTVTVTYISADINCAGFQNFGPVGYAYTGPGDGRAPLYSIKIGNGDYIITSNQDEIPGAVLLLGYVDTGKFRTQPAPARDVGFFDSSEGTVATNAPSHDASAPSDASAAVWETCSDTNEAPCIFLNFRSQAGQTHSLSCNKGLQNVSAILRYGTNQRATVRNLNIAAGSSTVPLIIDEDSTWASVRIEGGGESAPSCSILSTGGLQIGAASSTSGILNNGSFESALGDWQFCKQDDLAVITNQSQHGVSAIEISDDNCVYQIVEINPQSQYTSACYARNLGAGSAASLRFAIASNTYQTLTDDFNDVEGTGFQSYTSTLKTPADGKYAVLTFASSAPAIVDNCSIVEVSEP